MAFDRNEILAAQNDTIRDELLNQAEVGDKELSTAINIATSLFRRMDTIAVDEGVRPERCRAILLSHEGGRVAVVRRKRPGRPSYAVLPGGGVDPDDATPIIGVQRELKEELSLGPDDFKLVQSYVIPHDNNQWVYIGVARRGIERLALSDDVPERSNPAESGSYEPTWIPIADADAENLVPEDIRAQLMAAYYEQTDTTRHS